MGICSILLGPKADEDAKKRASSAVSSFYELKNLSFKSLL